MKKLFLLVLILFLAAAGLYARQPGLDAAIEETGKRIQADLPPGVLAAVVNIESPSLALSDYIAGELTNYLVNGKKIRMADRQNINSIESELALQFSGEVSDESIQAMGNRLSADFIITGSFSEMADYYRFSVQAVNTETTHIASSAALDVQGGAQLTALIAPDANGVRPGRPHGENNDGQYRVGYYGPAGGIVFYDKGRISGGWRYLEAAPAETETTCIWGSGITARTSPGIGTGSGNARYLVPAMKTKNLSGTAALYCDGLEYGGFDDWFLPSAAELEQMYKNLKTKGIGGFADAVYWTSSGGSQNMCDTFQFATGKAARNYTSDSARVRAVRAFK